MKLFVSEDSVPSKVVSEYGDAGLDALGKLAPHTISVVARLTPQVCAGAVVYVGGRIPLQLVLIVSPDI